MQLSSSLVRLTLLLWRWLASLGDSGDCGGGVQVAICAGEGCLMVAVTKFQFGYGAPVAAVGRAGRANERGVAQTVLGVEQRQLGAGVGAFLADDHPGSLRPGGQIQVAGDLGHPGPVTGLAVVFGRPTPRTLRPFPDGLADLFGDGETEAEPDTGVEAF